MKVLVLGGTAFLGRHAVEAALAQGHEVTIFTRGRTNPDLFPEVEHLLGDRDGALGALAGRSWDGVVDTSGYVPRVVRQSAELLLDAAGRYAFVSSISVYADFSSPVNESSPVAQLESPASEDVDGDYGALKAACERVLEEVYGERSARVRAGLLVGPHDPTGRFTYWPRRLAAGGDVLAPGDPAAPVQFVDARDLGAWLVRLALEGPGGVFNATGPARELSMRAMLAGVRQGTKSKVAFVWLANDFLKVQGVGEDRFPLYAPPVGETAGFHRANIARALAHGLKFRPVADTAAATLTWYQSLPADLQARIAPQFEKRPNETPWLETEQRVLAASRKRR